MVEKGPGLADDDFDVLGAWKDGALRRSNLNAGFTFGSYWCTSNARWSEAAAGCAYKVWRELPQSRELLARWLAQRHYEEFLCHLAGQTYSKAAKNGLVGAAFGLSRATYVLHVFSPGEFPIYDGTTHRGRPSADSRLL